MNRRALALVVTLASCSSEADLGDPGPIVDCSAYVLPDGPDSDADGLLDAWEDTTPGFDSANPDTDGDGTLDGAEDEDGDQLTVREEWLASELSTLPSAEAPRLDQPTILVELDLMSGFALQERALDIARGSFLEANVDVRFFLDECSLDFELFDGSFEQRQAYFADHPAQNVPEELAGSLIHMVFAARRLDLAFRPGEVISDGSNVAARSGAFIYFLPLVEANPRCAGIGAPSIKLFEAVGNTVAHELGHTLQLGHDTEVGGGVNFYNLMSVANTCQEAQQRFRGLGNDNPALGATEAVGLPRFSEAAVALMNLDLRLSVDTGQLVGGDGQEM